MSLPPIKGSLPKHRKVYGEVSPELYVQLEMEALQRGVSPYKLTGAVLEAFLTGGLVSPPEPSPSPSSSVAGDTSHGPA